MSVNTAPTSAERGPDMLTEELRQTFVSYAGSDYLWLAAPRGGHRVPSYARGALRRFLFDTQGGICPVCASSVVRPEFNHVVAQGPRRHGWYAGNVFVGCHTCNAATAPEWQDGELVQGIAALELSHFARPELIPTAAWPGVVALKKLGQSGYVL